MHDPFVTNSRPVWEWAAHLELPPKATPSQGAVLLKAWRLAVAHSVGMQLALDAVFIYEPMPHIHCLLLGRSYKDGYKSLRTNVSGTTLALAEGQWRDIARRSAKVSWIMDEGARLYMEGYAGGILRNMALPPDRWEQYPMYLPETLQKRTNLKKAITSQALRPQCFRIAA